MKSVLLLVGVALGLVWSAVGGRRFRSMTGLQEPYLSGSLNMSFLLYFSHEDFGKSSLWTPHTARHRLA